MKSDNPSHFVVVGVHKSGTTTLYNYFKNHPDFYSPYKKEIHFFTPLVYGERIDDINRYYSYFKGRDNESFLLDVSPSYLYGNDTIPTYLKNLKYPVKCLVVLRNPTERFISFYKQAIKRGGIEKNMSLEDYFLSCKKEFEKYASTGVKKDSFFDRGLRDGCYSLYLPDWQKTFGNNFKVIFFEDLISSPLIILDEIYQWLGITRGAVNNLDEHSNKSYKPRFQSLSRLSARVFKKHEKFFRKHKFLKKSLSHIYSLINKTDFSVEDFKDVTMIELFYKSYNDHLIQIMPDKKKKISKWNKQ